MVSYVVPSSASTPTLKNEGQQVTFNGSVSLLDGGNAYTGPVYVGNVTDTAQNATASSASNPRGAVDVGAFQLVDGNGQPWRSAAVHRHADARRADAGHGSVLRRLRPDAGRW